MWFSTRLRHGTLSLPPSLPLVRSPRALLSDAVLRSLSLSLLSPSLYLFIYISLPPPSLSFPLALTPPPSPHHLSLPLSLSVSRFLSRARFRWRALSVRPSVSGALAPPPPPRAFDHRRASRENSGHSLRRRVKWGAAGVGGARRGICPSHSRTHGDGRNRYSVPQDP